MGISLLPQRDVGHEPDYRFSLANERTFLAWIRTALALDAGGLGVQQLLPDLGNPWIRQALAVVLVVLGSALAATSFWRWSRNETALRTDAPLPSSPLPLILSVGVMGVSLVAVFLLMSA